MKKIKYIAPVLIALVGLGLQQAKADTQTYNLGTFNSGGFTPGANGFVTATVSTNGTNVATVTFTSNAVTQNSSGNPYEALMGDGGTVALNVNTATYGAFTALAAGTNSGTGFTANLPGDFSYGSGNNDGFGSFNLRVDTTDGFSHSMNSVVVTLTLSSGTWGLASTVLTGNNNGFVLSAHTFLTQIINGTWNQTNGAILTGFVANGSVFNTPDGGATVMLLGMALGALGLVRRYLSS
jgi:hypothetical protein